GLICPGSQQATVTSPSAILPRIFSTWCLGSHCCSRSRLKTCMPLDLRRNEGTASLAYSAAEQERGDCAQPTRIDRRGGRARSSTGSSPPGPTNFPHSDKGFRYTAQLGLYEWDIYRDSYVLCSFDNLRHWKDRGQSHAEVYDDPRNADTLATETVSSDRQSVL